MAHRICDCCFPTAKEIEHYRGDIPDILECQCGANEAGNGYSWQWEASEESVTVVTDREVFFHPTKSKGSAIVKGKQSLDPGMLHYWEMRAISPLLGPEVMFGIGTQNVNLGEYANISVSALGINDQSWGFSYSGRIQHSGEQLPYWHNFSQNCLVGVYLDRSRGHLEFYLNRKGLGVAYTNVPVDPNVKIYPMVCSTAAGSAIRLINCTSVQDTLQLRSFQALARKQPDQVAILLQIPGFKAICKSFWFLYLLLHYFG
ncbi:SPRY domain-containing SOCS box protein 3-like [Drosophila biarmipes]|uniref:SPRY domain-containing SOCS box protein 3-like n=1 Tax=Drosophila biarmipes TaxID=125945 RepID=UPI0021CCCF62|nr:SPRY domain-containing SOCS box protein 3-like [Drosophila biarmipes]XP_016958949.2 SPRY domain-containing SOCS box protein 3-like [Drosophila biarmipes]